MAQPLLSAVFSSPSLRIFNKKTGQYVLIPIRTIRVALTFQSRAARHKMEDGSTKVDQRILMPIVVAIDLIAPTMDIVGQVNAVTADREASYFISSRGIVIDDLRVTSQVIDQTPENLSSTPIQLTFSQLMFQGRSQTVYSQAADASLIDRGMALLSSATQTVSSTIQKIKTAISGGV